jgi:hypothetical protein
LDHVMAADPGIGTHAVGHFCRRIVRAAGTCASQTLVSPDLSVLGWLDYDVGVPNLYKGFGFFPSRLRDALVADWRGRNATNPDDPVD